MSTSRLMPLIDLVFLSLGAMLAAMTQMQVVTTLDVELARVGRGATVARHSDDAVLTMRHDGMWLDEAPVTLERLVDNLAGQRVLIRADRDIPAGELLEVIDALQAAGAESRLHVQQSKRPDVGRPQGGSR